MNRNSIFASLLLATAACSGTGPAGDAFRRAVPTRDAVRIDFAAADGASLAPVSPAYLDIADYAAGIDADIDDIFADLEEISAGEPSVDEETVRAWESGDHTLRLESDDGRDFELTYGEEGLDVVTGLIELDADGEPGYFELDIDLDAEAVITGDVQTGIIEITAMPFDDGEREVWYDFVGVAFDGEPPEDSITTYWVFDEGSGGLEFLSDIDGDQATAYARWDDGGGRYDHYLSYVDPDWGVIDEIATNCWAEGGRELFDAWAEFDEEGGVYGEIDGDEADCHFGPVDGHPDPGADFDDLPGEGEWQDLGI